PQDSVTAGHRAAGDHEMHDGYQGDPRIARALFRLVGIAVVMVGLVLYFGTGARRAWFSSIAARLTTTPVPEVKPPAPAPPAEVPTPAAPPTAVAAPPVGEAPAAPPAAG